MATAASTAQTPTPSATEKPKPSWYTENLSSIPEDGRKLLETYSGIEPSNVLEHVRQLRDKAFAVFAYACIGQVRFLNYSLPKYPYYQPVISRLREGATFLDAGCCFGQELRYLIHNEHIPAQQLYGFDLEPDFVGFGHDLFRDKDRLQATMLSGDLLAARGTKAAEQLNTIEDQMDVVHVASVLHVWGWDDMIRAAKRLVTFTRPSKGSLIVGNQLGSTNAGEYPMPVSSGFNYRHNDESMQKFWAQVGQETGTEWKVSSGMLVTEAIKANQNASFADSGMRMIWFQVERL